MYFVFGCAVKLKRICVKYTLVLPMGQTSVVNVRVPEELKRKMKQIKVNWSEYIRECVQKKIDEQKMEEASSKLDAIMLRAKPVSEEELSSWLREGRER